jgi:hypothetical protein
MAGKIFRPAMSMSREELCNGSDGDIIREVDEGQGVAKASAKNSDDSENDGDNHTTPDHTATTRTSRYVSNIVLFAHATVCACGYLLSGHQIPLSKPPKAHLHSLRRQLAALAVLQRHKVPSCTTVAATN